MSYRIFIGAMLLASCASAWAQTWQAARSFGSAQSDKTTGDRAYAIAAGSGGDVYLAGTFNQTLQIEPLATTAHGHQDMFVARLDDGGKGAWLAQAGAKWPLPGHAAGRALALDGKGHVFVAGFFSGRTRFSSAAPGGPSATLVSKGSRDIFLAKYDEEGNLAWATRAGGAGSDDALGVAVDSRGDPHITGYIGQGAADFSGQAWLFGTSPTYGQTLFVARYHGATGALAWARQASQGEASAHSAGNGIAVDPAGNVYVAGHFSRLMALAPTVLLDSAQPGDENVDAFVARYTPSGKAAWARQTLQVDTSGNGTEVYRAIEAGADSSIYVAGYIQSALKVGKFHLSPATGYDMVLVKYDAEGQPVWAHSTPSALTNDLSLDGQGGLLVAGCFLDATHLPAKDDPIEIVQPGEQVFAARLAIDTGFGDWVLASAGDAGTFPHDDCAQGIAESVSGTLVHVAGYFHASAVFGEDVFIAKTQGHNTADIFVARISK